MLHRRLLLAAALALAGAGAAAQTGPSAAALDALQDGGTVALIRHADAPGTGDPSAFRLGDCATQRNLGDRGREQAAALGRALREAGVLVTEVRSSRWCRALDTARLAFPDRPTVPDSALDSFFGDRRDEPAQTQAVRRTVAGWARRQGVLALVTHQVNVTALTGLSPAQGEVVVLRPSVTGFDVVGRWTP